MNYELAKELKGAGFPKVSLGVPHNVITATEMVCHVDQAGYLHPQADTSDYVDMPTLEELIEACGRDDWFNLHRDRSGTWDADNAKGGGTSGSTPTEAVAKLWLALNVKKV